MGKRILSICLMFSILYSIIGVNLIFRIEQYRVRKEAKAKIFNSIPEKELSLLKFHRNDLSSLNWTKENKEFRYNNNMYDIVRSKTICDTVYYYCFNDTQENNLHITLGRIVKDQTQNSILIVIQKKLVINYFIKQIVYYKDDQNKQVTFFERTPSYTFKNIEVLTPPPKRVF